MGNKIILFIVFIFVCCIAHSTIAIESSDDISKTALQRFTRAIAHIKQDYIKPISDKELVDNAINGMLSNLDPHSDYLVGDSFTKANALLTGEYIGIGFSSATINGAVKVIAVTDGSPADKEGLKVGDVITEINGKSVKDINADKPTYGPKGSKITLTILHKNEPKPVTLTLVRDIIKSPPVQWRLLEPNYGYIGIKVFKTQTSEEVKTAITSLKKTNKKKLQGVVIDLRGNGGGLQREAVNITNYLLDFDKLQKNKLITYAKGQNYESQSFASSEDGSLLHNIPIVVLINEGSASAAELIAGALQDHKRAIIAGERSLGKGSLQVMFPIDMDSKIGLTTALYYTPLGHSPQVKGITPDVIINNIEIVDNNQPLGIIGEGALTNHIKNGNGYNDNIIQRIHEALQIQKNNELALARKDYQLYEALHLLKGLNAVNNMQCMASSTKN